METEIYKAPLSELDNSESGSRNAKNAKKHLVFAFLIAPLASSIAFATIFALVVILTMKEFEIQLVQYAIATFMLASFVTYVFEFVFGLPVHGALGITGWRKIYIYVFIGAAIPATIGLLFGLASEPVLWFAASAKGAFCAGIFWWIAVYLFDKKSSNKRKQTDHQKAAPCEGD